MTGTAASQVPVSTACGQPAGWIRASGRVAGGQRLGVVAVETVDHPVDEGGGIHQCPSRRGSGYFGGRGIGMPYIQPAQAKCSPILSRILVNVCIGSSS
jgi:hypothetical protein